MADRNVILVDFQQCTGVDDLETCMAILEHHDWNLQEAVQHAFGMIDVSQPQEQQHADVLSDRQFVDISPDVGDHFHMGEPPTGMQPLINEDRNSYSFDVAAFVNDGIQPYGSPSRVRMLNFHIEYRQKNVPVILQDINCVGKIKELLSAELDIPVSEMELHGWIHKNDALIQDADILRDLHLPKENTLFLLTPGLTRPHPATSDGNDSVNEPSSRTYELNIYFVDQDKKCLIKFPGTKTIHQVKEDVVYIAGPVRYQEWHGWPTDNDSLTLAECGIDYPSHHFRLTSSQQRSENSNKSSPADSGHVPIRQPQDSMEVESDDDDYADAVQYDDIIDDDMRVTNSCKPLMPEQADDQMAATEHFCQEFASRYGETHPVFYIGSLDDALREALHCKARDRKLLAIYLHHDQSIFANVFCSQVLCAESLASFLSANFITWAWDLTHAFNREKLLSLCAGHLGSVAANTVRVFKPDQLPLLLIISRSRGIAEVVQVLHGNSTLDDLMMHLMHTVEMFRQQLHADIAEEEERDARERMLQEQDDAYKKSLEIDRAKAEVRKREEEQRVKDEEDAERRRLEEKQQQEEAEAEKEAICLSLADLLPQEPDAACTEPISLLRIRCPDGRVLNRRFLASEPLRVLLTYVGSAGFQPNTYKLLTTYPRKDLTQLDSSSTLHELKLFPQETLTIENV